MHRYIDFYRGKYMQSNDNLEKACIAAHVVEIIKENGGRFLQRKDDAWEVSSDEVARKKVGKALRHINKATQAPESRQLHDGSGPPKPKRARHAEGAIFM